ncbi:thiamine-phosphate kinase [Thermodesulfobacteriota bacterium]
MKSNNFKGLNDLGEFGFIRRISRGCLIRPQNVVKAIGDDAAVFFQNAGKATLLTTDLLVERVHFFRDKISGFNLGYKSLAINLSDIAAMGGEAQEAFISIAIPGDCEISYLEDFYEGVKTLATEFDVNILGGDTTGSKADLVINICVTGGAFEKEILYRHTAQKGDIVFSTGFLGDSRAGLHLIMNGVEADTEELKALCEAHMLPKPYLREGCFLAARDGMHAAIDVSDGLSSDIGHIAEESKVGVCLYYEKIPVSDHLRGFCRRLGVDPVEYALSGGEDYTLLCTAAPDKANRITTAYEQRFHRPLYPMGEITETGQMDLIYPDGQIKKFAVSGWDHFRKGAGQKLKFSESES